MKTAIFCWDWKPPTHMSNNEAMRQPDRISTHAADISSSNGDRNRQWKKAARRRPHKATRQAGKQAIRVVE